MNAKRIKGFIVGAAMAASSLGVLAAVNIPNTFAPNTPIKSAEVNANFTSLKAAIDALNVSGLALPAKLEGTNPTTADALLTVATKDIGTAIHGISNDPSSAAVGVQGESFSPGGFGVYGLSKATVGSGTGVYGQGGIGVWGKSINGRAGVLGLNENNANGIGVEGKVSGSNAVGVLGDSPDGNGVVGKSARTNYAAVAGTSAVDGYGIYGLSAKGTGVAGITTTGGVGVYGSTATGFALLGETTSGVGLEARSVSGYGVVGRTTSGPAAVYGESTGGSGGQFKSTNGYAVEAVSDFTALSVESKKNTAAVVTTRGSGVSALIVNQYGTGNIITGRDASNAEVFRVLNDGSVFSKTNSYTSDRNAKQNFSSVNALKVLEKVVNLPISRWSYKTDSSDVAHFGPMAQDFHAAFGLNGSDDTHINTVDAQGVALAAIQGLNRKLEAENARLRAELSAASD